MVVVINTDNEADLVYRSSDNPINFTVANGTGIEKGTLLKMTDPLTAAKSDGANDAIAGIAAAEKIANDGRTSLAVHRRGVFRMVASGAIATGQPVCSAGVTNMVKYIATASVSGAQVIGHAMQTFSDQEEGLIQLQLA